MTEEPAHESRADALGEHREVGGRDGPEPTFPAHLTLLGNGILIIENILLRNVPAGGYELIAPPVHLVGVDGGWCRALLRRES